MKLVLYELFFMKEAEELGTFAWQRTVNHSDSDWPLIARLFYKIEYTITIYMYLFFEESYF